MRNVLVIGALVALTGCSALVNPTIGMTPEQLKEFAKIKDAGCSKIVGVYMGATFTAISVSVDKGIPPGAGSVKIDDNCGTTITAEPKLTPAVKVP